LGWPGCPPGARPVGFFPERLCRSFGPSLDGGFDEFRDDFASLSFSSAFSRRILAPELAILGTQRRILSLQLLDSRDQPLYESFELGDARLGRHALLNDRSLLGWTAFNRLLTKVDLTKWALTYTPRSRERVHSGATFQQQPASSR
jgi:hypothetical protein